MVSAAPAEARHRSRWAGGMRIRGLALALLAGLAGRAALAGTPVLVEATVDEPIHHCRWRLTIRDNGRVAFEQKNCTLSRREFKSRVSRDVVARIREALRAADFCGLRSEYLPDWPEKDQVVVVDAPTLSIAARCGSTWKAVRVEGAEFIAGWMGSLPRNPDEDAARRFLGVWKTIVDAAGRPNSDESEVPNRARR